MSYPSAAQIAYSQAAERATMRDTCAITRRVETNTGGDLTTSLVALYSGPCALKPFAQRPNTLETGERPTTLVDFELKLPHDAPGLDTGDRVAVTSAGYGGTVTYIVAEVLEKTLRTRRRVRVTLESGA